MAKCDYTAEEIDLGLTYLVMAAGNHREASRKLKAERGVGIPPTTLRDWRVKSKASDYAEIKARLGQKRREEMAEDVIALGLKEIKAAHLAVDQVIADLNAKKFPAKDVPKALQQISVSLGIGTDKANVLLDRPTEIVAHNYQIADVEAAMRAALQGRAPERVIDAEVVEPAELTEGDQ